MNRNKDAVQIWWGGASNSIAVSRALTRAIEEVHAEGGRPDRDTACQMLVDHLAFLLGMPQPSFGLQGEDSDIWVEDALKMREEVEGETVHV